LNIVTIPFEIPIQVTIIIITTFIADINQQNDNAERLINRDSLTKWAGEEKANGFDSHSIFYDENQPELWHTDLGKPETKNIYQPFLSHSVALTTLHHMFLNQK